jgi:hypothetical protein
MLRYMASIDPEGYRVHDRNVRAEVLQTLRSPTSFTFVRNPYSRIAAVYVDKFANFDGRERQRAIFGRYKDLRPDMTFAELVQWLATDEGSDQGADPHLLSQHYFVLDKDGRPAIDLLAKADNIEADLRELQETCGLTVEPLPHLNSNSERGRFDSSTRWLEMFDDRSKRIIASRYDGDFEFFEYERLPYTTIPMYSPGARPRHNASTGVANGNGHGHARPFSRLRLRTGRWLTKARRRKAGTN